MPGSINAAFVVLTVLAIFLAISGILSFVISVNATTAPEGGAGAGFLSGFLHGGLVLFFAFKVRKGRNWARITLTVLFALFIIPGISFFGVALFSPGAFSPDEMLGVIVAAFFLLVSIVLIVLMFRPTANAYFRASSAQM